MATPFVVLGLKATDKLIDDHLHKLPDKYFHTSTYNPANVVKSKKKRTGSREGSSSSQDRDINESDEKDIPKSGEPEEYEETVPKMAAYPPPRPPIAADIYSHEPPKIREEYIPPTALAAGAGSTAAPYFPPPPIGPYDYGYDGRDSTSGYERRESAYDRRDSAYDRRDSGSDYGRHRSRRYEDDDNGDNDSYYNSASRHSSRPKAISRRSQSHPGHRSRGAYDDDDDDRKDRYDTGSQHVDRALDRAHRYGLKDEIRETFTDSKKGLAASAVGAVVGGWAASKAQVAYDKKNRAEPSALLTLLGAAAGGLVVNAVVDKFEDSKRKKDDKQDRSDAGNERGSDQESDGYSERDGKSRRMSRRHDRGYDSGYD